MDNLTPNTPLSTLVTPDLYPQFPLLKAYHLAIDPLAYIIALIISHSNTFILELMNFLN